MFRVHNRFLSFLSIAHTVENGALFLADRESSKTPRFRRTTAYKGLFFSKFIALEILREWLICTTAGVTVADADKSVASRAEATPVHAKVSFDERSYKVKTPCGGKIERFGSLGKKSGTVFDDQLLISIFVGGADSC